MTTRPTPEQQCDCHDCCTQRAAQQLLGIAVANCLNVGVSAEIIYELVHDVIRSDFPDDDDNALSADTPTSGSG